MSVRVLKGFQDTAVERGLAVFAGAKALLDATPHDAASRAHTINHNGYLLLEAPTGSGKTLIAGNLVERFSHVENVVWFWFAPFKGVVGQTLGFLREEFAGLRLRELQEDRAADGSRRGDVFVTTWQTVATRVTDRRNVRKDGELNPSMDELVKGLRKQGFRVGVVVDEAHHGFHEDTLAAKFFHEILDPEYTILITATPDDADIKAFEARLGIAELRRTTISRQEVVDVGLIKEGIKCVAYFAEPEKKALVDFEGMALADGVALHRRIKSVLASHEIKLTPLMLVQVDSTAGVQRAKERLLKLGFTDEQVAIHTAEEPDPSLLALANDEAREVLMFKMAGALGFDAPRAFTLVSMRALKDPDFGVQIVGRILRVHRRLQGRKLPEILNYGYVFLADPESQTAIDVAGQRINQVRTEYAKASPTTVLVRIGEQSEVRVVNPEGQLEIFQQPVPPAPYAAVEGVKKVIAESNQPQTMLNLVLESLTARPATVPSGVRGSGAVAIPGGRSGFQYRLRAEAPKRFKSQVLPADFKATEEECAAKFMVSARELLAAMAVRVKVQKRTLEVFSHQMTFEDLGVSLSPEQAAEEAERVLTRSHAFHAKELREALVKRMCELVKAESPEEANDPVKVERFLDVILASHPELLREAQRNALIAHAQLQEAEEWPAELFSQEALPKSRLNGYGVLPPGLNSWERGFVGLLDRDSSGAILWWQRNPPHKPWSVRVLLNDGRGFFPDFILGVKERLRENSALLTDTKFAYELHKEQAKILAEHQAYGRVLILHQVKEGQWSIVRFRPDDGRPVADVDFRIADASRY